MSENSFEPKDNYYLTGFESAEKIILDAWKNNALHQSWLISGEKGIGKTTFAYRIARFLLSADENRKDSYVSLDVSSDNPVFKQIASGAHPDFKIVERGFIKTERQKIEKAVKVGNYMTDDELKTLKKSSVISVEDVRTINDFLAKKSADGRWRVVIVDCADEMNHNSANAILKILEEPPHKSILLLISHNPTTLLPTIKSRCAKLAIRPLEDNVVASLLRRYRPELKEDKVKKIAAIAGGSIGKAIVYADENAIEFYEEIYALATSGKKFKIGEMLDFCDEVVEAEESYMLFKELILKFLNEQIKSGNKIEETAKLFSNTVKIFNETEKLNLDKKQAVMIIMNDICNEY